MNIIKDTKLLNMAPSICSTTIYIQDMGMLGYLYTTSVHIFHYTFSNVSFTSLFVTRSSSVVTASCVVDD